MTTQSVTPVPGRTRPMHSQPPGSLHFPALGSGRKGDDGGSHGPFAGAHHFTLSQPVMVGKVVAPNKMTAYRRYLLPHVDPSARVDSKARHPPPRCHPGTRQQIDDFLKTWLLDPHRRWKMTWLNGPAGVGKSAVAQTFAEYCAKEHRLGAAFFSGPNSWNDTNSIIPTLAYQLAVHNAKYRKLLNEQIASDPTIVEAAMHNQFRKLIVDPLLVLQMKSPEGPQEPHIIILDGLDMCGGEDAQYEIVEMIGEVVRLKKDLPLLWLISSRPEPHLEHIFSREDFGTICDRKTLSVDDEAREDVERYLRARFKAIRAKYPYTMSGTWPSEEQFTETLHAASGLFVAASTILRYVDDSQRANPPAQLDALLSFVKNAHGAGDGSPFKTLDCFYARILSGVASDVWLTTRKILLHHIYLPTLSNPTAYTWSPSTRVLCNFLRLDQGTFYGALQRLHSVIDIPSPQAAMTTPLRFHHTSFIDYLRSPARSGMFVIEETMALIEIAKSFLYWHEIDSVLYHANDGTSYHSHEHAVLPDLKWTSDNNIEQISREIAQSAELLHYAAWAHGLDKNDSDLLSQVNQLDFRYMNHATHGFTAFIHWLYQQMSKELSNNIIRLELYGPMDQKLLDNLNLLTSPENVKPITFLPNSQSLSTGYFIIGHGKKACIIYFLSGSEIYVLSNTPPSKAQISEYHRIRRLRDDNTQLAPIDSTSTAGTAVGTPRGMWGTGTISSMPLHSRNNAFAYSYSSYGNWADEEESDESEEIGEDMEYDRGEDSEYDEWDCDGERDSEGEDGEDDTEREPGSEEEYDEGDEDSEGGSEEEYNEGGGDSGEGNGEDHNGSNGEIGNSEEDEEEYGKGDENGEEGSEEEHNEAEGTEDTGYYEESEITDQDDYDDGAGDGDFGWSDSDY